jgi:hypothetical protein
MKGECGGSTASVSVQAYILCILVLSVLCLYLVSLEGCVAHAHPQAAGV